MTEVRFYHLQKQTVEQALPLIISKAYQTGKNIIVRISEEKEISKINDILWSFSSESFLPHGSCMEDNQDKQPIYITNKGDNPNNADIVFLTHKCIEDSPSKYSLICEMLNGNDSVEVEDARLKWKKYKEDGFEVTYWQQDENGRWSKKA